MSAGLRWSLSNNLTDRMAVAARAKGIVHRYVVEVAAGFEIVVGAIFLTAPDIPCRLLFAATPEGIGTLLGRFAGVALVALGITCLTSGAQDRAGMLPHWVFWSSTSVRLSFSRRLRWLHLSAVFCYGRASSDMPLLQPY